MTYLKNWELSEGNTSLWAISPLNARVRIADIKKHSPMNGIDSDKIAQLMQSAPKLLRAINLLLDCPDLNHDSLEDITIEAINNANEVLNR